MRHRWGGLVEVGVEHPGIEGGEHALVLGLDEDKVGVAVVAGRPLHDEILLGIDLNAEGRPWKVMEGDGRWWKVVEGDGR